MASVTVGKRQVEVRMKLLTDAEAVEVKKLLLADIRKPGHMPRTASVRTLIAFLDFWEYAGDGDKPAT